MPRHFQTNTILDRLSTDRIAARSMVVVTQQPYDGTDGQSCYLVYMKTNSSGLARSGVLQSGWGDLM